MSPDFDSKNAPVFSAFLSYFPAAAVLVSRLCKFGNDKHNPGEPLHHARGKSMSHKDAILCHLMKLGTKDEFDLDHAVAVAWRANALVQELAEQKYGWPLAPGAKPPVESVPEPFIPAVGDKYRRPDGTLLTITRVYSKGNVLGAGGDPSISTPHVYWDAGTWSAIEDLGKLYKRA